MGKFSSYAADPSPTTDDYFLGVDATTGSNRRILLSALLTLFYTQTNIPVGGGSVVTRSSETQFDHVAPNTLIITADSVGVNRNASISAGTVYINGRRLSISASTARTYTASKDTYVDVLDNLDGTGTLVFTETTNNAASAALAANSIRIGIVVTGATTIATTGSINQGQENKVLPIASSVPYAVTDSLGNLICPRDSSRRTLGHRQVTANQSVTSGTSVQVTGLSVPVTIPATRKVKLKADLGGVQVSAATNVYLSWWDGTVGSGTLLQESAATISGASFVGDVEAEIETTPSATSKTYNVGIRRDTGTVSTVVISTVNFARVDLA